MTLAEGGSNGNSGNDCLRRQGHNPRPASAGLQSSPSSSSPRLLLVVYLSPIPSYSSALTSAILTTNSISNSRLSNLIQHLSSCSETTTTMMRSPCTAPLATLSIPGSFPAADIGSEQLPARPDIPSRIRTRSS